MSRRTAMPQEPDISMFGLSLWVHGWQFPEAKDDWDANWLRCSAECRASGSIVEVSGSFLSAPELEAWLSECVHLYQLLKGEAVLSTMEPTLNIGLEAKSLGHIHAKIEITPEHLSQRHSFEFDVDQTYLAKLISQLRTLLQKFPVRGSSVG